MTYHRGASLSKQHTYLLNLEWKPGFKAWITARAYVDPPKLTVLVLLLLEQLTEAMSFRVFFKLIKRVASHAKHSTC